MRVSTSASATARQSKPPRPERSCSPGGRAATATTRASITAAASLPATHISRRIAVVRGRAGLAGTGDRLRRQYGSQLRGAPALRGAHQRCAGRPARLPLGRARVRRPYPLSQLGRFLVVTRRRRESRTGSRAPTDRSSPDDAGRLPWGGRVVSVGGPGARHETCPVPDTRRGRSGRARRRRKLSSAAGRAGPAGFGTAPAGRSRSRRRARPGR